MLNRFFKFVFSFGMVFGLLLLSGCQEKEGEPLRVGMNTWPGYEPFMLGKEEKYFASNVSISRLDSATDVIKSLKSDIIDVACVTLDEAIILQDQSSEPIKVIAIMDFSKGGDAIIAEASIADMRMLKGKRIGVESSALGSFMLTRAIELTDGLSLEDLEIIHLGYEHHEKEFMRGTINAVVTFEPVKSKLLEGNAHVLFDSTQIPGEIVDVMVIKEKTIAKKHKAIQELLDGWFKSVDLIEKKPKPSMEAMAGFEGISYEAFKVAYTGIEVPNKLENRRFFNQRFISTVKKLHKVLEENQLVQNEVNPELLYYDAFLTR